MSLLSSLRSFRVGQFAVFDFAGSFVGAYLIARHFNWDVARTLWLVLPLSVLAHALTQQDTPLTRMALEPGHLEVKLLLLLCLYKSYN